MVSNLMDTFNEKEIYLLTLLINKVNNDTIADYWFERELVDELTKDFNLDINIIDSLIYKKVIKSDVIKRCEKCNEDLNVCECEEQVIDTKEYIAINLEKFIEYFVNTFVQYYKIEIEKIEQIDAVQSTFCVIGRETKLQINFKKFQHELSKNIKTENKLIISVMPLDDNYDNSTIFEWHEILDKDNINKLKIKLEDLNKNFTSKDFYYLDIGDDCSVEDVENIRTILRKYLINNGYKNYTENIKYRPEYVEYNFPIDKIKECFIFNDSKILVFKPSEKEISIAYFKNHIIGDDEKTHELLYKFDHFMKNRVERLRHIRFSETKSDKMQKFIELCGPAINIFVLILSIFSNNDIFKNIVSAFKGGKEWFLYIYIIINLVSLIFIIIYSILPAFSKIIFRWDYGLNKIK
jgi:hypothetical protein